MARRWSAGGRLVGRSLDERRARRATRDARSSTRLGVPLDRHALLERGRVGARRRVGRVDGLDLGPRDGRVREDKLAVPGGGVGVGIGIGRPRDCYVYRRSTDHRGRREGEPVAFWSFSLGPLVATRRTRPSSRDETTRREARSEGARNDRRRATTTPPPPPPPRARRRDDDRATRRHHARIDARGAAEHGGRRARQAFAAVERDDEEAELEREREKVREEKRGETDRSDRSIDDREKAREEKRGETDRSDRSIDDRERDDRQEHVQCFCVTSATC